MARRTAEGEQDTIVLPEKGIATQAKAKTNAEECAVRAGFS